MYNFPLEQHLTSILPLLENFSTDLSRPSTKKTSHLSHRNSLRLWQYSLKKAASAKALLVFYAKTLEDCFVALRRLVTSVDKMVGIMQAGRSLVLLRAPTLLSSPELKLLFPCRFGEKGVSTARLNGCTKTAIIAREIRWGRKECVGRAGGAGGAQR